VYEYIKDTRKQRAGALYGTSGAGKTRSIFEYLSLNFGLYLVPSTTEEWDCEAMDFGSFDLSTVLRMLGSVKSKEESEDNVQEVGKRLKLLVYVRQIFFEAVHDILGDFTPYEWLLLQLSPKHFFGHDIFECALSDFITVKEEVIHGLFRAATFTLDAIFVDEVNVLLRQKQKKFLGNDGTVDRSNFSGIFKGLSNMRHGRPDLPFHVFAGTGMSMDVLEAESNSATAKQTQSKKGKALEKTFIEFLPQSAEEVLVYFGFPFEPRQRL
jgi:hypothetical protein